jgi:arsenite methyltransferase
MNALSLALDTPALAEYYEKISAERQFKAGKLLFEALRLAPAERVLDVGSGTGALAEFAADLVGPSGSVVGVDPLPLRVELANARRRDNLSYHVGNANALSEFAAESFDVVYLNAVFHWLPEKLGPLREFRRVLKPGGRLGVTTGEKGTNTLRALRRAVLQREPYSQHFDPHDDVGHNVTADELRSLLEQSGFRVSRLEVQPHVTHHPDAKTALDFAQASSFGNFFGRLPDSLRESARATIEAELEAQRTPEGIVQRGARIFAVAIKD